MGKKRYINVEFQVFHLTLTLNTNGWAGGCRLCYNYQFSPLFLSEIVDILKYLYTFVDFDFYERL